MSKNLKVAIVHDWLVGGGSERVVEQLHKLYPDAPIYTSYCTPAWRKKLDGKVVTGYLQRWPFGAIRRIAIISSALRIQWFGSLDFSGYDLVISSTGNGEANDINVPEGTKHISYCHAPTHYYWRSYKKYLANPGFGPLNFFARIGLRFFVGPFRKRDYKAAQKADYIIANSHFIAEEIKKYYDRDATVINPPVDTDRLKHDFTAKRAGYVTVGRQVLYKHTELLVDACTQLDLPLKVVGNGPEHADLVRRAGPTVSFHTDVSDAQVISYLAGAEAFLFAAIEDFGIAPVEALAAGTPVIALDAGGARDYVIDGKTGLFFEEQTSESLCQILEAFDGKRFSSRHITSFAQTFSEQNFRKKITDFITDKLS